MSALLAGVGQVVTFAVGIGGSPLTIVGLLPLFAIGLTYMRYSSIDPESHPIEVKRVSTFFIV